MTPLRIGTRGSALATTQTSHVAETLTERSGLAHELVVIRTEGDVTTGSLASLGGTGVFASALRAAVLTVDALRTGPAPGVLRADRVTGRTRRVKVRPRPGCACDPDALGWAF